MDNELVEAVKKQIVESEERLKGYIDQINTKQRADLAVVIQEWRQAQEEVVESFFQSWGISVPKALTARMLEPIHWNKETNSYVPILPKISKRGNIARVASIRLPS